MKPVRAGLRALAVLLVATVSLPAAQRGRPLPYAVTDVSLDRAGEDAARWTLLLRDGRIEALQPADEPLPAGYWRVDAGGALALPAFVDAYTRTGCATPEPQKDQDRPLDERSDVRIDMREANRKGIQPAFEAASVLAFEEDAVEAWHAAGFGAALVCPGGELLAGSGVPVAVRDAAPRDLVLGRAPFQHGTFRASGPGYPSTNMGYAAQLRQFFLDARHHQEARERFAAGRPGVRPPHDAELESGIELLEGERRLACHADDLQAIERWMRLARELGLRLAFTGAGEAWRVADRLAAEDVPVVLDLDWSEEVKDPFAIDEKKKKAADEPREAGEEPGQEAPAEGEEAPDEGAEDAPDEESDERPGAPRIAGDEIVFDYVEPLAVRAERRRIWEEERDNALRLAEAGVRFAFGSTEQKPRELLKKVRQLVEAGLPDDAALAALTTDAARILGQEGRLGRLEPGFDATFCLWTGDPLGDEKAKVAWIFVDGFPREFELEDELEGTPDEGVDPSGSWTVWAEGESGTIESQLELEMAEDGTLEGRFTMPSLFGEGQWTASLEGRVAGKELRFELEIDAGEFRLPLTFEGTLDGDRMEGKVTVRPPGEEPDTTKFRAEKDPERRTRRTDR